jgi:hypothetical protein
LTSNIASAVSTTRQTTIAAISIGLPIWSLTLSFPLSKLRILSETKRRMVNGLTQRRPGVLMVPW